MLSAVQCFFYAVILISTQGCQLAMRQVTNKPIRDWLELPLTHLGARSGVQQLIWVICSCNFEP